MGIDMITLMKKRRQVKVTLAILLGIAMMIGQQVNSLRKSTVIWSLKEG